MLAHFRTEAGYDRDLARWDGALTPFGTVLIVLDLALAIGITTRGSESIFAAVGVYVVLAWFGRLAANPDRARRRAGVAGSSVEAKPFGVLTGLQARGRVRRRMGLQDREPQAVRDPGLLRRFVRARAANEIARAEWLLAAAPLRLGRLPAISDRRGERARAGLRRALDRLDAPPDAGEDALVHTAETLDALDRAVAEAQSAREAGLAARRREMLRLWPGYMTQEEPFRTGGGNSRP